MPRVPKFEFKVTDELEGCAPIPDFYKNLRDKIDSLIKVMLEHEGFETEGITALNIGEMKEKLNMKGYTLSCDTNNGEGFNSIQSFIFNKDNIPVSAFYQVMDGRSIKLTKVYFFN